MAEKVNKNSVDLICNVGELAGVFEKSDTLKAFLQQVVSVVAYHMKAAVCSVYLFDDEKQELLLTANQGLNPDAVGKVRLKIGEGITGQALKELRPICEGCGQKNPFFKLIPALNEEPYESILAVPILRGLSRVGVLVVQDTQKDYFEENDLKALRAIAAQLATTIENAKLLLNLHQGTAQPEADDKKTEIPMLIKGTTASPGLAFGKSMVLGHQSLAAAAEQPTRHTLDDFVRAVARTEEQLQFMQQQMDERLADVASMIFSAHLIMLKDSGFSGEMQRLIKEGAAPAAAIMQVVDTYENLFSKSHNTLLREKVQDVQDLGRRLLRNLSSESEDHVDYRGYVIIGLDLYPSDILKLVAQHAEAIIQVGGGVTSHIAILARSLQIPMVIVGERKILDLPGQTPVGLDADQGNVFVRPGDDVIKSFESLRETRKKAGELESLVKGTTVTQDGVVVKLLANINLLNDLDIADRLKAEGVGLYRSEFPFIVRNNFPSEEEQYRIYRRILDRMKPREVVFRTLDIGGDKMLSYFPRVNESNPFLGLRAIRFSLKHKDIFSQQIRALLRAGEGERLKVMFPLISSVDDFIEAREVVMECIRALDAENVPHNGKPELGVMIELPSAVEVVDELAAETDFLSIGSNDLVQYVLAVDRTNEHISDLYVPHHPAVLRSLKRIAEAASKHHKPLSICGDIASGEKLIPFLLGIGIRTLSVDAHRIPRVQAIIEKISMADAEKKAEIMLKMGRIKEVVGFLDESFQLPV